MKKLVLFIMTITLFGCQSQNSQYQNFNLNYEEMSIENELPNGWIEWGDFVIEVDSNSHSGDYCGYVKSNSDGQFGCIAYPIPAIYSGKKIKLEGYMKIKEVRNGFSGLMMRVDGKGNTLAFDNMSGENINGTIDWKKYSIELDYPSDADTIYVAGILIGDGEAWYDDFTVTIDGKDILYIDPEVKKEIKSDTHQDTEFENGSKIEIQNIDLQTTTNLELLGRVWGFMKYHHPDIANGMYNWDNELFRFLPKYLEAKNIADSEALLSEWINQYDNFKAKKAIESKWNNIHIKADKQWIENISNPTLKKQIEYIYEHRSQGSNYYIEMAPNVGNPIFKNENAYKAISYPDDGYSLLTLYRYWNMINYFFPYRMECDKDWNTILGEYIPQYLAIEDELAFESLTVKLVAEINDTHGQVHGQVEKFQQNKGILYPPVHLKYIEDNYVVADFYNKEFKSETKLEIGDIITKINNKAVETLIEEMKPYYPASNDRIRIKYMILDLLRSNDSTIDVEYLRDNKVFSEELKLYNKRKLNFKEFYRQDNVKAWEILENNILYINLGSITDEDISEIKENLVDTKGTIIDIRNYPKTFVPFKLGSLFISKSTPFVKFTQGSTMTPGDFYMTDPLSIPSKDKAYSGKLVVLVNEKSISQSEYTAMAFRAGENTTIVGNTTAGADGNVSSIILPGGIQTMISGIGVYYPDGGKTQRIGIIPDVVVNPTIKGLIEGRDEYMEKAISIIMDLNATNQKRTTDNID